MHAEPSAIGGQLSAKNKSWQLRADSANCRGIDPLQFALAEGGDAGDGAAEDQGVYFVRALVGPHALQVAHVAHGRIVERDAVTTEDGACFAGYLYGLPDIVELAEAYVLGPEGSRVLHPAYVQREERSFADFDQHVRQLLLDELEGGYGPPELFPLLRVVQR